MEASTARVTTPLSRGLGRVRHMQPGGGQYPLTLLIPALFFIGLFYVLPNLLNFFYAFTDWSTFKDEINVIGTRNFSELAQEGQLVHAAWTTLKFALVVVVVENVVALCLALALERSTPVNVALRVILFIPVLVSSLAAGFLFKGIFATDGTLNDGLGTLLGRDVAIQWLGSTTWTLVILALVHTWKFGGVHMLVYLAALKTIPRELIEAARIEGAGAWQTFWRVRMRLLAPAFTFNITLTMIGALSAFDVVVAMTSGGPGRSTQVLNLFIWQQYGTGSFGYATALSLVLFLMIVAVAIPLVTFLRRREVEL
jgi:multiple sugar transport system permease protein/raffinose/stachyose/melibiose transport system permease protein